MVGMDKDKIELDFIMLQKILKQLINSDGMEVTNDYLIKQKIYYIDNMALIEELEKIILEYFYEMMLEEKGYVNSNELLEQFSPIYINYDKSFTELEKKHSADVSMEQELTKKTDNTLNRYFE